MSADIKEKNIKLEVNPVGPFFSDEDEAFFFRWLDKIKCVKKYEGRSHTLCIEVDSTLISENELREMVALFLRYDVDMKQLSVFKQSKFSRWLETWHELISGDKTTNEDKEEAREWLRTLAEKGAE